MLIDRSMIGANIGLSTGSGVRPLQACASGALCLRKRYTEPGHGVLAVIQRASAVERIQALTTLFIDTESIFKGARLTIIDASAQRPARIADLPSGCVGVWHIASVGLAGVT